jgi:hypothetical protein
MKKYIKFFKEDVASTILQQLGGNKFIAMTGAKYLAKDKNSFQFRLPRAKDGINFVKITLNGKDLYDIDFGRISGTNYKIIKQVNDIYFDQLQEIFTQYTGLYTHL